MKANNYASIKISTIQYRHSTDYQITDKRFDSFDLK